MNNEELFELEDDVEIPTDLLNERKKGKFRSTVSKMKINQSFLIDNKPKSYYMVQKKEGVKLISKREGDKIRIWRIA